MSRRTDITDAVKADWKRRYEAKESAKDLAKEFGTTSSTVLKALRGLGVTIRKQGYRLTHNSPVFTKELRQKAFDMKEAGMSGVEVAEALNCSISCLYKHLSFRENNNPHLPNLQKIRDTLAGVCAKAEECGRPNKAAEAQLAAMEWVLSVKLPKFDDNRLDLIASAE